ncbi:transposase [Streptomyces sp. NPDC091682]|uniref:transposase n=1 Tax=Streptomyces sp. NPDC091682 TaxID=3366005 RepID=UPI00382D96BB
MVHRHEPTDVKWEALSGLLSRSSSGRPRLDDRRVLNGIAWKLRTGSAWRDAPARYGPWRTLHTCPCSELAGLDGDRVLLACRRVGDCGDHGRCALRVGRVSVGPLDEHLGEVGGGRGGLGAQASAFVRRAISSSSGYASPHGFCSSTGRPCLMSRSRSRRRSWT